MSNMDLVYYLGIIFILGVEIWLLFVRFEEYDHIKLEEHIGIIILHIIIVIIAVIIWRLIFNFLFGMENILSNSNNF